MNKELEVVNSLVKATGTGKVAWRTLDLPGVTTVRRYLGSLRSGRSFLLQGPASRVQEFLPVPGTIVLEIRDANDRAYTIQDDPQEEQPLAIALRNLYALVAERSDAVLDDTLEELGVKASS